MPLIFYPKTQKLGEAEPSHLGSPLEALMNTSMSQSVSLEDYLLPFLLDDEVPQAGQSLSPLTGSRANRAAKVGPHEDSEKNRDSSPVPQDLSDLTVPGRRVEKTT